MGRRWRWLALAGGGLAGLLWLLLAQVSGGHGSQILGQEFPLGAENTSLQVQNIGSSGLDLVVEYYGSDGSRVAQETRPGLRPGAAVTIDQALNGGLPSGFRGAAVVTADGAIRTLLFKDITGDGRKSLGADNAPGRGFNRQHLPLIYSRFGEEGGWNTRFVVQNASSTTSACVRLTYRRNDGSVVFTEPAAGAAPSAGCPNGGLSLPPRGSLVRDQAAMAAQLPPPFVGSVVAETVAGAAPAAQQFLVAMADIWNANRSSFATYKGLGQNLDGSGDLDTTVLLPLIQKGYQGGWHTQYQVSAVDPTTPTTVTVVYCCDPRLSGPGGSVRKVLAVLGSLVIDQRLEPELPEEFSGAATLTSDRPIAVVVVRRWRDDSVEGYSAYSGIPRGAASATAWLPLVYRQFSANWQSWFQVQVVDGGAANVEVAYYGEALPGGMVSFRRTVQGVAFFDQSQDALLPAGFSGAAVLRADRPLVAAVLVYSDQHQGDAMASFGAFGKEAFQAVPTPTPVPTPPPTATPLPTPSPTSRPPTTWSPRVQLSAGWNVTQWQPAICRSPSEAFASLIARGVLLAAWRWVTEEQSWQFFFPSASDISTLRQVCGGQILWVNVAAGAVWVQGP